MSSSKKSLSSVKDAEEENDHHSRGAEAELNSGAVENENDADQNEYPSTRLVSSPDDAENKSSPGGAPPEQVLSAGRAPAPLQLQLPRARASNKRSDTSSHDENELPLSQHDEAHDGGQAAGSSLGQLGSSPPPLARPRQGKRRRITTGSSAAAPAGAARGAETEADIKADEGAGPGAIEFEAARRWGPRTRWPQKPKAQGAATIPQPQPPHFRCLIEAVGTKVVPFLRPVEVRSLVCAIPLPSFVTEPFYNDLVLRADPSTLKKLEKKLKLTLEKPPPKSLSSTTQCRHQEKLEQRHFHRCNYFQLWRYMCESCGILSKHGRRANGTGTLRLCEECLERWTDRAQFEKQLRHLQLPLCWTQRAAEGFAWIEGGGDAGGAATGDLFRTGILEGQMDAELLAALWQSLQDGLDTSSRVLGAEKSFGGGARGSGRGGGQSKLDSEDELEDGGNEDGYWSEDRDEDDSRAGGGDEEDHDGAARRRRLLDGQALVVVPSVLGIRAEIVAAEELCQRSATRKNGCATTRHDIIKASTDENYDDPMISSSMSTPESFDAGGQSVVDMIEYGHQEPQHDHLHRLQNLRSGDTTIEQESCFATGSALSRQFSTLAEVEARLTRLQAQDCLLELPLDFAGLLIPTPSWREYEQALQKNKKLHFELFKDWRNVLPAMATAFESLARSSEEASAGGDEHHLQPSTTGSSFSPSCPHRRSSSPRLQEVQHLRAAASFLRDCLSPDTSAFSAWDEFWQQLLVEKYDRSFLKTCNRGKAHFIRQSVAEQVHARFSSKIFYKRHDEGVTLLQNAADLFREWIALLLFIADVEDVISFCPDRCEQIVRASQKMLKQLDRRHLQAIPVAGFAYKSRKQKAKESWDGNLERLRNLASAPGFKWDLALRGVAEADAGSSRNDYSASNYRDYTKEHIASTLAQLFRGGGLLCSPSATTVEELTDGATAHHSECWHDSDDAAEDVNGQEDEMITSRKLNKSAGSGSGSQRQRNAPAPLGIYDADLMNPYDDHILERWPWQDDGGSPAYRPSAFREMVQNCAIFRPKKLTPADLQGRNRLALFFVRIFWHEPALRTFLRKRGREIVLETDYQDANSPTCNPLLRCGGAGGQTSADHRGQVEQTDGGSLGISTAKKQPQADRDFSFSGDAEAQYRSESESESDSEANRRAAEAFADQAMSYYDATNAKLAQKVDKKEHQTRQLFEVYRRIQREMGRGAVDHAEDEYDYDGFGLDDGDATAKSRTLRMPKFALRFSSGRSADENSSAAKESELVDRGADNTNARYNQETDEGVDRIFGTELPDTGDTQQEVLPTQSQSPRQPDFSQEESRSSVLPGKNHFSGSNELQLALVRCDDAEWERSSSTSAALPTRRSKQVGRQQMHAGAPDEKSKFLSGRAYYSRKNKGRLKEAAVVPAEADDLEKKDDVDFELDAERLYENARNWKSRKSLSSRKSTSRRGTGLDGAVDDDLEIFVRQHVAFGGGGAGDESSLLDENTERHGHTAAAAMRGLQTNNERQQEHQKQSFPMRRTLLRAAARAYGVGRTSGTCSGTKWRDRGKTTANEGRRTTDPNLKEFLYAVGRKDRGRESSDHLNTELSLPWLLGDDPVEALRWFSLRPPTNAVAGLQTDGHDQQVDIAGLLGGHSRSTSVFGAVTALSSAAGAQLYFGFTPSGLFSNCPHGSAVLRSNQTTTAGRGNMTSQLGGLFTSHNFYDEDAGALTPAAGGGVVGEGNFTASLANIGGRVDQQGRPLLVARKRAPGDEQVGTNSTPSSSEIAFEAGKYRGKAVALVWDLDAGYCLHCAAQKQFRARYPLQAKIIKLFAAKTRGCEI